MQHSSHHAIITGGNGSLATVIAHFLQSKNWTVDSPGRAELDVKTPIAIQQYFKNRSVDLLICAAGITSDAPIARLKENVWDETWQTNFRGAANCAKAAIPQMIERGGGHILFISSFSALHPPIGQSAYGAAKAALLGLTKDLAVRYGSENIRINTILPGFLETQMTKTVSDSRRKQVLSDHTLARFNECEQVAKFIHFLHHDLPHTSGQLFQLDSRVSEW